MQFPVYLHLGSWTIHPHPLFESLAYMVAFRLALRNFRQDTIAPSQRTSVIVGGLAGGLIGAKGLVLLQHLDLIWGNPQEFGMLVLQGKTVVGGLLGAIIGVEITKYWIGVKQSTGDAFVWPLIFGMMIGRVGCFLTGLSDRTYGIATTLPWGIDFGDGVLRHPTQLYEILFLFLLFCILQLRSRYKARSGDLFKFYTIGYLSFRFLVDFIKPDFHPILGLSAIQIACGLGIGYYWRSFYDFVKFKS
jgi:phosphatidylglycerol---prolipoprotein diacylglyceryl transferase